MWRADGYDHNYVLNDEPSSTDKKSVAMPPCYAIVLLHVPLSDT